MELYYAHKIEENLIFLDEEESRHCVKVMRHKSGDALEVTDGKGKRYTSRIIKDDHRECVLERDGIVQSVSEAQRRLHLAIAPTKNIDRFEWFLEKATELGIDEITPIICQRSERDKIKPDRLKKILVAAMKQSLRLWLPKLNGITKFRNFIDLQSQSSIASEKTEEQKLICHCNDEHLIPLKNLYQLKNKTLMLIGPEGDFTPEEISFAEENGFTSVSLGSARLRTETAGIVAVHTVQLLNG